MIARIIIRAKGIKKGDSTQNQLQDITPQSFKTMKAIPNRVKPPTPLFPLLLLTQSVLSLIPFNFCPVVIIYHFKAVAPLGFEPRLRVLETPVLPLHHGA